MHRSHHMAPTSVEMTDASTPVHDPSAHPSTAQVAAFLDGSLRDTERERVVSHLAECAECRRELVELRGALGAASPTGRRRGIIAAAAIAAGLAFVLLPQLGQRDRREAPPVDAIRVGDDPQGAEAATAFAALAPADGAELPRGTRTLVWRAAAADAMYMVTVQDSAGAVVWSGSMADTSTTIPSTASLMAGQRYFWSVDARLADGATAGTGVRTFTAR
jgi:hypothetical protein